MMSRKQRLGLVLAAAGLLAALAVLAAMAARESRSLGYTVVFKDAAGLKPGCRVQLRGLDIGAVKWVRFSGDPNQILVRVRIDPQDAGNVRLNSTAVIRRVSAPNGSGESVVEIVNPETQPAPPPLPRDTIVQGVDEMGLQVWKLKGKLHGASDALKLAIGTMAEMVGDLSDSVQNWTASPEVRQALTQLRAFMIKMQQQGRQAVAQLQAEWPRLRDQMKPVLQRLATTGKAYAAEELQAVMRQIEDTLSQWQREEKKE